MEPAAAIDARAAAAWDRVLRLIGYFDLDPNRALDVMLDVFSVHLATHYRFFLSFLLSSPWSSRSTRQPSKDKMAIEPDPEQYRDMTLDEVLQLAELQSGYIAPSSPFSPNGSNSRVLAQVLGFKFTYYQVYIRITLHKTYIQSSHDPLVSGSFGTHAEELILNGWIADTGGVHNT